MRRVGEAPFVPQLDVEFVLFIVLASDEPAVIGAVTQTLSNIGIETHLATPEGGPGVLLDYEKAHYVPIALGGKLPPSDRVESTEGEPRWRAKPGLKALLFPNSPVAGDAEFLHIELDPRGRWLIQLVESLEYLGLADELPPTRL